MTSSSLERDVRPGESGKGSSFDRVPREVGLRHLPLLGFGRVSQRSSGGLAALKCQRRFCSDDFPDLCKRRMHLGSLPSSRVGADLQLFRRVFLSLFRGVSSLPWIYLSVSSRPSIGGTGCGDSAQNINGNARTKKRKGTRAKRIECTQHKRYHDAFTSCLPREQHMSLRAWAVAVHDRLRGVPAH